MEEVKKNILDLQLESKYLRKKDRKKDFFTWFYISYNLFSKMKSLKKNNIYNFQSYFINNNEEYNLWYEENINNLKRIKKIINNGYPLKKRENIKFSIQRITSSFLKKLILKNIQCITSLQIQKMLKINRNEAYRLMLHIIKIKPLCFRINLLPKQIPNKNKILKTRKVNVL